MIMLSAWEKRVLETLSNSKTPLTADEIAVDVYQYKHEWEKHNTAGGHHQDGDNIKVAICSIRKKLADEPVNIASDNWGQRGRGYVSKYWLEPTYG